MLLGEFINQAKEKVEDAWDWKALSGDVTFTTVLNQTSYTLSASASPVATVTRVVNERATILYDQNDYPQVFDITDQGLGTLIRLERMTREDELARNIYLGNSATIFPAAFSYSWENGSPLFFLVGRPVTGRNMRLRMKMPQEDLAATTDNIIVPWRSVVSYATFLAMEERGEELSEKSTLYLNRHDSELQRAIERDQSGEDEYTYLMAN